MTTRKTTNALGQKFHQVMAEKGIAGDYKALADAFGVTAQSVYGWIDSATIGKDKFTRMVEWSGRSLHWWFDIDAPIDANHTPPQANEGTVVYHLKSRAPWPFSRPYEAFDRLRDEDKARIDGYMAGMIDAECNSNRRQQKSEKQNGSQQGP